MTPEQERLWEILTPLQQRIVTGVEAGKSPSQAYVDAGGTCQTKAAVATAACKLLNDGNVLAYRRSLNADDINPMVMSRAEMRARLTSIARGNLTDIARVRKECIGYNDEGEPLYRSFVEIEGFDDVPEDSLIALQEVTQKEHGITIKMQNQIAAMKALAELDGLDAPKATKLELPSGVSVTINAVDPVEAAAQYQALMR